MFAALCRRRAAALSRNFSPSVRASSVRNFHQSPVTRLKPTRYTQPSDFEIAQSKAAVWEEYLNTSAASSPSKSAANPHDSVVSALNHDLDAQWSSRQHMLQLEALKKGPEIDSVAVSNFLRDFDASRPSPSTDLVSKLIHICLKAEFYEKAVEYFVWGGDAVQLPPPESVATIMSRTRRREGWQHIRQRLSLDLRKYYPEFTEKRNSLLEQSRFSSGATSSARTSPTPSSSSQSTSSSVASKSASPSSSLMSGSKPSPKVDWINFVSDPLALAEKGVSVESVPASSVSDMLLRRDTLRQESLKKFTGFVLGDRQKRVREEVKDLSDAELRALSVEDHVKLSSVIEEMVWRGMADEALVRLQRELEEAKYLVGQNVFMTLASHYRDAKNVAGMLQLLQMMMAKDVAPDIALLNAMLELHVNVHQFLEAAALWKQLRDYGVAPNTTTIAIVVRLLTEATIEKVRIPLTLSTLLKFVHSHQIPLNDTVYTQLLNYAIVSQNFMFAKSTFSKIKNPNAMAYGLILRANMAPGLFGRFMYYYNQLERYHGTQIDYEMLKTLQKASLAADQPRTFLVALKHQLERHKMQITIPQFKILATVAMRHGFLHLALQIDLLRNEFFPTLAVPKTYIKTFLDMPFYRKVNPKMSTLMELGGETSSTSSTENSESDRTSVSAKKMETWNKIVEELVQQKSALDGMREDAQMFEKVRQDKRRISTPLRYHRVEKNINQQDRL